MTSSFLQSLVANGLVQESEARAFYSDFKGVDFDVAIALYRNLSVEEDRDRLGLLYGSSIGRAHVPLARTFFQPAALDLMVPELARQQQCIPVYLMDNVATVAMAHPEDAHAVARLAKLLGREISPMFSFPQEIENSIEIQYGSRAGLEKLSGQAAGEVQHEDQITPEQLKAFASSAGVVHLLRGLLLYCIKHNASDIHIQPTGKALVVRFRIDGRLQTALTLNKAMGEPLLARLKVLSGLNITERRKPQDGRVSLDLQDRSYDFRLSTVPTAFGEKAVVRAIGSSDKLVKSLGDLGFTGGNRRLLEELIRVPNGVLYVTGPTGSGKTTTLYSVLNELNTPEVNIVTVEDPVELRIEGISQIQVNPAIELDFAMALRAILRQDPQIVLVGEIRDLETARIASQAALTGHLVMATLHTNNSFQAITRLVDIGLEPHLVAPSVIGVLAQRLVRRICRQCKMAYKPTAEVLDSLFHDASGADVQFHRGHGCDACGGTGYAGRIAVHEIFVVTDRMRDLIARGATVNEVEREARKAGFRSMRYDGIQKVLQGLTTLEEVERVTRVVRRQA